MAEQDVVVEAEAGKGTDGKVDMTGADAGRPASPAEGTAGQDASGKDDKTTPEAEAVTEGSDDKEVEEALKSGAPIPYERFKKWNDGKNSIKTELEALRAENEGVSELLNNPVVFRAVLQAKGITDPKILSQKMKEAGFEEKAQEDKSEEELFTELSKGLDLTTQKGWFEMMRRMSKHFSEEAISPIKGELSKKEIQAYISAQESEATQLAKDVYGLEYGVAGKDESNPNTAIGRMMAYLKKHPEDAGLGHVKILHLALAKDGVKLGEKQGEAKEKERVKKVKDSAFEGDGQAVREGAPNSTWTPQEIIAWRQRNVNK